jgi:hypothetical protein
MFHNLNKSQETIIILPINLQLITRGVSHYNLAIYMKTYLKAKEELWKLKYFTMQKFIIFKKPSKKQPKSLKI